MALDASPDGSHLFRCRERGPRPSSGLTSVPTWARSQPASCRITGVS